MRWRFLTWHEVIVKVGLSSAEMFELQEDGDFPKEIHVSGHQLFLQHEVEEWMDERVRARDLAYLRRRDAEKDARAEDD